MHACGVHVRVRVRVRVCARVRFAFARVCFGAQALTYMTTEAQTNAAVDAAFDKKERTPWSQLFTSR